MVAASSHANLALALKKHGPMIVGVDTDVVDDLGAPVWKCSKKGRTKFPDHAVALIGLVRGRKGGYFFKIQNSWGENVGENGMHLIPYQEEGDACGLLFSESVFVEV